MGKDAVKRMLNLTKGNRWYMPSDLARYYVGYDAIFIRVKVLNKYSRKIKYGMRKSYFKAYQSHRKRGIDYLPF
jgi:hypothetical protein